MNMKKYISKANWINHNEIHFAIASKQYAFKRYDWLIREAVSLVPRLLGVKGQMDMRLRGWKTQVMCTPADNNESCDYIDVIVTMTHQNPDITALENRYIHSMINKSNLLFQDAMDKSTMPETLAEVDK
jgi:hypothetical protein